MRPVLKDLYHNATEKADRPNIDEIVMIKSLFLQAIYNISDEALESELHNRLSFKNFLNYPEIIPDAKTICISGNYYQRPIKAKHYGKQYGNSFR
ncbi:MAG: transposase [Candidatus Rehaiarchaeum fermentans]|nr:transposase [Candidatus Rehaiarchaeum fermentans]